MRERNYTAGSVALQFDSNAVPKRGNSGYIKERKEKRRNYAGTRYAPSIGLAGFIILSALIAVFTFYCVKYLRLCEELKACEKNTLAITREANALKLANDNFENNIYASLDLEKVRKTAIKKLGMVYPDKKRIIRYKSVENSYVRQFGELKDEDERNILKNVVKVIKTK